MTWDHVDLGGRPDDDPPIPPSIEVWHSVRDGGDTKTKVEAGQRDCVRNRGWHRDGRG